MANRAQVDEQGQPVAPEKPGIIARIGTFLKDTLLTGGGLALLNIIAPKFMSFGARLIGGKAGEAAYADASIGQRVAGSFAAGAGVSGISQVAGTFLSPTLATLVGVGTTAFGAGKLISKAASVNEPSSPTVPSVASNDDGVQPSV